MNAGLPSTTRIILADDHAAVCRSLKILIQRWTDWEVVGEAQDAETAERLVRNQAAELLIIDVAIPVRGGFALIESLRKSRIMVPILVFSKVLASQYVPFLKSAGAQGFVGKDENEEILVLAMRRLISGGTFFPRSVAQRVVKRFMPPGAIAKLSLRENAVVKAIQSGTPLVAVATEFGINARSIASYRRRALDKLGLKTNAELINLLKFPI